MKKTSLLREVWNVKALRPIIFCLILAMTPIGQMAGPLATGCAIACLMVLATFILVLRLPLWIQRSMVKNKWARMITDLALSGVAILLFTSGTGSQLMTISAVIAAIIFSVVVEQWAEQMMYRNLPAKTATVVRNK